MKNSTFRILFSEARNSKDKDIFISEWSTSSLFGFCEDPKGRDKIIHQLSQIWDVAHMTVSDLRAKAGMTQIQLSDRFCIPLRTVQGWESKGGCAPYIILMMAEMLGIVKKS